MNCHRKIIMIIKYFYYLPRTVPVVINTLFDLLFGFPGGSEFKASASNAEDPGSIPGLG